MSNSKIQKKFSYILLFSILCSFALYFSNKSLFYTSENLPSRVLQELEEQEVDENGGEEVIEEENTGDEDMKDICSNGPEDLYSYYYNGIKSYDTSSVESTKSEAVDALIAIIQGDDLGSNAKTYGMSALKWIIFIGCAILMILGWIVCIICMCCNCCCCTCCCKKKICNIIIFLLCAGCFATVFVLSTHSFVAVKNAMKGMNGASCSLLQFIHEIIDGQSDKSQTPYWIGIDGINKVLNDVSQGIDNTITNNADDFFYHKNQYDSYISSSDNYIRSGDGIDKENGELIGIDISDAPIEKIYPECVFNWGSTTTSASYLNLVNEEYNEVKERTSELVSQMDSNFREITNCDYIGGEAKCQDSQVKGIIDDSKNSVNDMQEPINNLKSQVTDPLIDYQNLINDYGKKYCRLVFLVLSAFCAIIVGLLLFFKICNCIGKMIKLIIHILWNILALFTIVCFLIGGIIGLVGKVGKDLVDVMAFVTSPDNLNSENPVLINKIGSDVSNYLTTCLAGDGDLATSLNLREKANSINELNELKQQFEELKEYFENFPHSKTPHEYENNFLKEYYSNNFFTDSTRGNFYDISEKLKLINEETVGNDPATCANIIDEKWSYQEESGYSEIEENSVKASNNSHKLINIYKIKDESFYNSRYYPNENEFCNGLAAQQITNNTAKIFKEINDFFTSGKLIGPHTDIKSSMDGIYSETNEVIDSALDIITQITDSLNRYVGESGSVWELLNCKFMGLDLNILLRNLDTGLGDKFLKMGTEISTLAILQAIGIVLTLICLNIETEKDNKKKGNVPPKKSYINKNNELESINIH